MKTEKTNTEKLRSIAELLYQANMPSIAHSLLQIADNISIPMQLPVILPEPKSYSFLDTQDFFDLMQQYRHAYIVDDGKHPFVTTAFDNIKRYIKQHC